jgi:hypothetical protein
MGEGGKAVEAELVERALKMFIEWLNARIRLWEEFSKASQNCYWMNSEKDCERRRALASALGLSDCQLLDDPWYDHDCADRIAGELRRILRVIGGEHA